VVRASQPGRFNSANDGEPTQYMTLHPLGPFAELMRRADLRSVEQARALRIRSWVLDVPLDDLPAITFDSARDFGITADELVSDDHGACQELARRVRGQVPGLLVPSAALPGTRNVVLFGPRVAAPYLTEPVSAVDIPASITAEDGRSLSSLLSIVRFMGDKHAALEAWRHGLEFSFLEPEWSLE
jgi:hypothetical protein